MPNNAVYFDITTFLKDNGFGTLGVDLNGSEWLIDVDAQTIVLDGIGTPSVLKASYEQPSVQILVRGIKGGAAHLVYTKAKAISDFLLSQPECVTINATVYKGFEQGSNIAAMGKDEDQRHIYSMNFITYRRAF